MVRKAQQFLDPAITSAREIFQLAEEGYWSKMIEYYKGMVHDGMKDVPFVEAMLEEPGIIGAAMLCHDMKEA